MTNIAFKLEDSGFSREQVEALTEFMGGNVASKADIERLEEKITTVRGELKADIESVKGELKTNIESVKGELKADIAAIRGELKITHWMLGMVVAGVISLVIKAFFV